MRVLLATDAPWLVDELVAVARRPRHVVHGRVRGAGVAKVVARNEVRPYDIGIFDLQIGSMGGMAVTMSLRLDESSGRVPHVPVVMLLDRFADVHLSRRSGADGWMVKPLDPLRIRRAVRAVTSGDTYREGFGEAQAGRLSPLRGVAQLG